jgi:serine/threonine-protein kinase RsbW
MEFHFQIKNRCSELAALHTTLVRLGEKWSLSNKTVVELNLILDELTSNIVEHGDSKQDSEIDIKLTKKNTVITLVITDEGPPFDPTITPPVDIALPLEERKCGGLGIHLIRRFSDNCKYKRVKNRNVLTLEKTLY